MGTFSSGQKIMPDIIDEIADGMLATGLWWNVDSTWNTTTKTGNSARRSLAYGAAGGSGKGDTTLSGNAALNAVVLSVFNETGFSVGDVIVIGSGATAECRFVSAVSTGQITVTMGINTARTTGDTVKELDFEIFFALEFMNAGNLVYPGGNPGQGKGFRVVFSSQWDWAAHMYSGGYQASFIMYEMHYYYTGVSDIAAVKNTYWMWYDANGFAIIGTPDSTGDPYQQSFFCVVERNPNKQYADGLSNFYCYNTLSTWNNHFTGVGTEFRVHNVMRPFAFMTPEDSWNSMNYNSAVLAGINAGIAFPMHGVNYAFRSVGNNKVYFHKPWIMNTRGAASIAGVGGMGAPIFQSELFFVWSEGAGLIDGDVIMLEGTTRKYVLKALASPDSSSRLVFAIKYTD